MASHPHWHQHHPTTIATQRPRAFPPCTSDWIEWHGRYVQRRSSQRSLAMQTTKNLPGRCMPPLRSLRHANGWRRWKTTMHNCQHTPQSESTIFCHPETWGSVPRTSVSPNYNIPSPMQGLCSTGLRRWIPHFLANLTTWQGVYRNSRGQWSCSSLSQSEKSFWPQCQPNGWK